MVAGAGDSTGVWGAGGTKNSYSSWIDFGRPSGGRGRVAMGLLGEKVHSLKEIRVRYSPNFDLKTLVCPSISLVYAHAVGGVKLELFLFFFFWKSPRLLATSSSLFVGCPVRTCFFPRNFEKCVVRKLRFGTEFAGIFSAKIEKMRLRDFRNLR